MVLTTDSSPEAGELLPSVIWLCSCSVLTPLHIGVLEEGFWSSSFILIVYAFASPAVNHCCLQSNITGVGVSPASHSSTLCGVMGSAARMDFACQFRRSWRSSRTSTSMRSHQHSLPSSATAQTQAILRDLTHSGPTLYTFIMVTSVALAALEYFMHWL